MAVLLPRRGLTRSTRSVNPPERRTSVSNDRLSPTQGARLEELLIASGLPPGSAGSREAEKQIDIIRAAVDRIRRGHQAFAIIQK